MYHRKDTRPVRVGNLTIGGSDEVIIQSMCTTKTADVEATVAEIRRLEEAGCQLVRVTVNNGGSGGSDQGDQEADQHSAGGGYPFQLSPGAGRD